MTSEWEKYYAEMKEDRSKLDKLLKGSIMDPRKYVIEAGKELREKGARKALDLGCGVGRNAIPLAELGFRVYAFDISESALEIMKERLAPLPKSVSSAIQLTQGDMKELPYQKDYFDAVFCISTLGHAVKAEIIETANEVFRVLKEGGLFFFNVMSVEDPHFGTGKLVEENTFDTEEETFGAGITEVHHFFTEKELREILHDFSEVEITKKDMPKWNRVVFFVRAIK